MITSLKKLEGILNTVADGISVIDTSGRIIFVNGEAARLMGFQDVAEVMSLPASQIMERYELLGETGESISVAELPSRRAMKGERATAVIGFRTKGGDKPRWSQVKSSPIMHANGSVEYVVSVFHDVTDQKMAEKQVDFFLGMTGHELKTPLASIKALTQLLQRQFIKKGDEKTAGYMAQINEKVDTLTNLINDLRDTARIREGILEYRDEVFSATELVRDVVQDMSRLKKSHVIEVDGPEDAYVLADKVRIRQVITNLLRNAVKYSPESNRVLVRVFRNDRGLTLEVEDFGIGVPEDQHEVIFDPFSRGANTAGSNIKGLGIGLYISREILRHYGGDLTLTSKPDGTIFTMSVPARKP